MKATAHFKQTIQNYLEQRAANDILFAVSYEKQGKNIEECITYVLNTVQNSGSNGFADDEIYSMAVHYYDEDNINIGNPIGCKVVVNHTVELTQEEKEEARRDAIKQIHHEAYAKMKQPKKPQAKQPEAYNQPDLFNQ
jgi:hypothetical protein